jgi:hypothetical protein
LHIRKIRGEGYPYLIRGRLAKLRRHRSRDLQKVQDYHENPIDEQYVHYRVIAIAECKWDRQLGIECAGDDEAQIRQEDNIRQHYRRIEPEKSSRIVKHLKFDPPVAGPEEVFEVMEDYLVISLCPSQPLEIVTMKPFRFLLESFGIIR